MSLKISISGIRGVVGRALDAEVVTRFAAAYANWLPEGPVVVARDTRPSGPMVLRAVEAALLSTGHDVVHAGILSTPGTEYLVQTTDAVGGVIVTASHNPVEWNALKLLKGDGLFLDAEEMEEVVRRSEAPRRHVDALEQGRWREDLTGNERHIDAILALDLVDAQKVAAAGLKVVVDAVEGAGGEVLPALLRRLGVEVIELHCGLTGRFPHDPEPRVEHLEELRTRVAATGADLGLAVDPDVDRLALVDAGGRPVSEELTLVVAADHVLARRKGSVVVNLSTTLTMDRLAARHGVPLLRTPVGEAHVVRRMLEEEAVVGGEGNGGVILPALHPGRDAPLGAALVLSAVAEAGSLRACLDRHPPTSMVKDKVALEGEADDPVRWEAALRGLGVGGSMDAADGLKYDLGDRWVHLRRSNTENALRIIAEAADEATARGLIQAVRGGLGL
jgi:phosphomannomutase